jgi:hypothetical protein
LRNKVLFMEQHFEDLKQIRSILERSTKFISLSGYAGVAAGTVALGGLFYVKTKISLDGLDITSKTLTATEQIFVIGVAVLMIVLATVLGLFFTHRKSKTLGINMFSDAIAKKTAISLLTPLAVGGVFSLVLLQHQLIWLCLPSTLIFYGLGLVNASRYTDRYTNWLGIAQLVLGCLALIMPEFGSILWAIGFGILHIVYGFVLNNQKR